MIPNTIGDHHRCGIALLARPLTARTVALRHGLAKQGVAQNHINKPTPIPVCKCKAAFGVTPAPEDAKEHMDFWIRREEGVVSWTADELLFHQVLHEMTNTSHGITWLRGWHGPCEDYLYLQTCGFSIVSRNVNNLNTLLWSLDISRPYVWPILLLLRLSAASSAQNVMLSMRGLQILSRGWDRLQARASSAILLERSWGRMGST